MSIIIILVTLLFLGGIIALQIYLSHKENKWFGLVLPAISLIFALLITFAFIPFTTTSTVSSSEVINGEVVETIMESDSTQVDLPAFFVTITLTFVVFNIPTIFLLLIYFVCREKRKKNFEIAKMNIQDLE